MANYETVSITNSFTVTDEEKYQQLYNRLVSDSEIYDFSETDKDGTLWHQFGSYSSIGLLLAEDDIADIEDFIKELQKILPEGEMFTYKEIGHEKLKSVNGFIYVATNKTFDSFSLDEFADQYMGL